MKPPAIYLIVSLTLLTHLGSAGQANVRVWGSNAHHQCDVPPDLTNAIAVSVGAGHMLALRSDGTVVSWGSMTSVPSGVTNVVAVNAMCGLSAALKADGTVTVWDDRGEVSDVALGPLPALTNIADISGKYPLLLVLTRAGTVYDVPVESPNWTCNYWLGNMTNVVAISGHEDLFAALREDSSIAVWQDGHASSDPMLIRAVPPAATNVIALSAGRSHVLALRADRTVVAWGDSLYGDFTVPEGLTNVVGISAGSGFSFAVRADGTAVRWGSQTRPGASLPLDLPFVVQIAAGDNCSAALVQPDQATTPPTILQQPQPSLLNTGIGSSASLRAVASGFPPLTYQWYFGDAPILLATNTTLKFSGLTAAQSGSYRLAVSNGAGTTWSEPAILNVLATLDVQMVPTIVLRGNVGSTYRIEYISPLGLPDAWTPLITITLTNSPQFYIDLSAMGQSARLYRSVLVP